MLLQAAALGNGQLSVVEPLLVLELPATLILASWVFRSRLGWREWACVAAMAVALAGIAIGANLAVVGTLVARRRAARVRRPFSAWRPPRCWS